MVYSPRGVVLVVEYDDHTKKATCISLCSRFVHEYDFEQIDVAFSETGHEVAVETTYTDGDIVQFKLGTKVSIGMMQTSDDRFCKIVKTIEKANGAGFRGVTIRPLIPKSEIIGHASRLTQSLLRLRWHDLESEACTTKCHQSHEEDDQVNSKDY